MQVNICISTFHLENEDKVSPTYGVGMLLSIDNTDIMAVWNAMEYVQNQVFQQSAIRNSNRNCIYMKEQNGHQVVTFEA